MPGREESPSAELGQLLLQGWTMLAEACYDCQLPLMRDPATMLSHCVGCRRVYNTEGQVTQDGSGPAAAGTPASTQQTPLLANGPLQVAPADRADRSPSLLPAAANAATTPTTVPFTVPAANGPVASPASPVGQPSIPTSPGQVIQGNGAVSRTAGNMDPQDEIAHTRQLYQQMRQERRLLEQRQQQQLAAGGDAAAVATGESHDPAQLLADKLLAGWAMLADHCPRCTTPLMRQRNSQEVRCVVCDLPVRLQGTSAAAAPGLQTATVPAAAMSASAAAAAATIAQGAQARTDHQATAEAVPKAAAQPAPWQPANAAAAPSAAYCARTEGMSAALVNQLQQQRQVLLELHEVLLSKLQECKQNLAALSMNSYSSAGCRDLLENIHRLVHSIHCMSHILFPGELSAPTHSTAPVHS